DDLMFEEVGVSGNSKLWKITVRPSVRSTRDSVNDRIYANTKGWQTWDFFDVTFRFKKQDAATLVVRSITTDIFGGPADIWRSATMPQIWVVDLATFRAGQNDNKLKFLPVPAQGVKFAVFAAKFGAVERAFVLMPPLHGRPSNLLIVISHSFGQNDAHYNALGYANPLSIPLIRNVTDRFVLERWGPQLLAASNNYSLLMPVRARAGGAGGELGPFVEKTGLGAQAIQKMIGLTNGAVGIDRVDLVTFSNGITAANQF